MIEKILGLALEGARKVLKTVKTHFEKHGTKYAVGGGVAAIGGGAYVVGKSVGHKEGKKEGTVEQAARDEKKMKEMHQKHENDRKRWNEQKQAYEDLLDEFDY